MVMMRFKVLSFFLLLISFPSLLALCQQSEGDLNGDSVVNAEDVTWIKDNPELFWTTVLQEQIGSLNGFISQIIKHFDSSCPPVKVDVLQFGAIRDGITNDGPAFQKALDNVAEHGGGSVFIPAGTYFIDRTLIIHDNTEIFGEGEKTILLRGDTPTNSPLYQGVLNCEKNVGFSGRELFSNDKYNCGNSNIFLHSFAVDGSRVKTTPGAVTLSFSAVKNLRVEHLSLRNLPQDGIFVRNGGVNTVINNNLIDGHNLLWYNGGGIIIEMHGDGNLPVTSVLPVRIEGNTIFVRGPDFCQGSATCISNVVGIIVTWVDGVAAPVAKIVGNTLKITNGHSGIACHGCRDSLVENNILEPLVSDTMRSELFTGIISEHPRGGYGRNITIKGNTITGSGKLNDGRAILLSSNDLNSENAIIRNNIITQKNIMYSMGAIGLRGYHDFLIQGNQLTDIAAGPGIEIGNCDAGWLVTQKGVINENKVSLRLGNPALNPITLRRTQEISLLANVVSPDGKTSVNICN